jgi:enediyne biosynthesis protein E3
MGSPIAERVECIVEAFKIARGVAETHGRSDVLLAHLSSTDIYYRSVAFEGAAMGLALKGLSLWREFLLNDAAAHAVQVHIGLGWALAEMQHQVGEGLVWDDPDSVLDGYGYYHGLFRRRLTIRSLGLPPGLIDAHLPAFDRGVGRSLWYISKGDVEQLKLMVQSFPSARQPYLWKGVGIAVAFVGGCTQDQLLSLRIASGSHSHSLLDGAERAFNSRRQAGTPTDVAASVLDHWRK